MYNKRPTHDLHTDIEELGNDSLTIVVDREDTLQGGQEVDVMVLVSVLRHVSKPDNGKHDGNDGTDGQIGGNEHTEVAVTHSAELSIAEQGALVGRGRIQFGLDEVHGDIHATQRTHGVEALSHVQTARSGLLGTHGQDVWIT